MKLANAATEKEEGADIVEATAVTSEELPAADKETLTVEVVSAKVGFAAVSGHIAGKISAAAKEEEARLLNESAGLQELVAEGTHYPARLQLPKAAAMRKGVQVEAARSEKFTESRR